MNIYLDFDGTVVEHNYPKIGPDIPGALYAIKRLQDAGHTIILNTMRENFKGPLLKEAMEHINQHPDWKGSPISQHTPQKLMPQCWSATVGQNALFIDDADATMPLQMATYTHTLMIDWAGVTKMLEERKIINA